MTTTTNNPTATSLQTDKLAARLTAKNRANWIANEIRGKLTATLTPYIGCKVTKVNGDLLAKLQTEILDVLTTDKAWCNTTIYRNSSAYNLNWVVKTSEQIRTASGWGCVYQETSVYIGELDGAILARIPQAPKPCKTNYNLDEILKQVADCKALEDKYETAKSNLFPFADLV